MLGNILTSSGSLNTVNGPSNSGRGVYSKSSTSWETISLLQIRNPCKEFKCANVEAIRSLPTTLYTWDIGAIFYQTNCTLYLAIYHVRYHDYLISLRVRKFQR